MEKSRLYLGLPLFVALILFLAACAGTEPSPPEPLRIAFISFCDGNYEIRSMELDDEAPDCLLDDCGTICDFQWSPDGRKIAFIAKLDNNDNSGGPVVPERHTHVIHLKNFYNDEQQMVIEFVPQKEKLCWSPDGRKIAFVRNSDGNKDIWVMNADGGNQINLTKGGGNYSHPRWSPAGL